MSSEVTQGRGKRIPGVTEVGVALECLPVTTDGLFEASDRRQRDAFVRPGFGIPRKKPQRLVVAWQGLPATVERTE